MIKRTLYFGNPSYLSYKDSQLVIKLPEVEKNKTLSQSFKSQAVKVIPVEDIGVVVLDHQQITVTQGLLAALTENNVVIINCDSKHMPFSLLQPTSVHHAYTEKLRYQLNASLPLKKNLWQQTVVAKIYNQAILLDKLALDSTRLHYLKTKVKSGDIDNCEGRAASYYWKNLFSGTDFKRNRHGEPPNNLFNYGYAILRGVVARSLVASGLLPVIGIHHRNKYNPYCLADDMMEPYRPIVDELVMKLICNKSITDNLSPELKRELLHIPALDIKISEQLSPLMVGMQRTTASLMQCFEGVSRKLVFPEIMMNEYT